jgi:hypothetical protein
MASQKTKSSNTNWHDYQETNKYKSNIELNQKIRMMTSKDNYYIFTRAWDDTSNSIIDPNLWEYTIDGIPIYSNSAGTGGPPRATLMIESIDDLINYFYNDIDPITLRPKEIPVDITIN